MIVPIVLQNREFLGRRKLNQKSFIQSSLLFLLLTEKVNSTFTNTKFFTIRIRGIEPLSSMCKIDVFTMKLNSFFPYQSKNILLFQYSGEQERGK